jgi:phosphatidylglycerol:prolipoprotein diacylglycerol transferase
MRPILFELPWLDVPMYAYGTMLYLSFIVGYVLALRLGEKEGLPRGRMEGCFAVTALCALAAARLLQVATHPESFHSLGDVLRLTDGGMVAYGGFLGGLFGSIAFCRTVGVPVLRWGDCAVPALCTGLLLTRIGCLLAGCDFGKPWDGPWAVQFPVGSPAFRQQVDAGLLAANAPASLPVHPTQVYESLTGVVLLVLVLYTRRHRRSYGEALAAFAAGYAVLRFGIETLRDDTGRGFFGPLSTSQWIAILTFVAAAVLFARLRRLRPTADSSRVTHQGGMSTTFAPALLP